VGRSQPAVEYDGEQHRIDPARYAYDIERSEDLAELGWLRIGGVKQNRPLNIIRRVRHAWSSSVPTDRRIG
jgi:very-short-patch-repair endonuclease